MNCPVYILGAGGHGRVVLELIRSLGYDVAGFTDPDRELWGKEIQGVPVIGGDDEILKKPTKGVALTMGMGGVGDNGPRMKLYQSLSSRGFIFPCFSHPAAMVSESARLGNGTVVMAGVVVQAGCLLGENVIINTGALVDHDCHIEDHAHIAPGAVLSGNVSVGSGAHVGTGAVVIQGIRIGERALVAAGAVVVKDVKKRGRVSGVPAKEMKTQKGEIYNGEN